MNRMGTREATVTILLLLVIMMLAAVILVYHMKMPPEVCTTVLGSFTGAFGALMIALNVGPRQTPPPGGGNA